MSIEATSIVWKRSRHKGTALLLMLSIADRANDDGTGAYPGIKTLAKRLRLQERQVQNLLRKISTEPNPELHIAYEASPYGTNVYTILYDNMPEEPDQEGVHSNAPRVQSRTEGGALQYQEGVQSSTENEPEIAPNTSYKTSDKTSDKTAFPNPVNAWMTDPDFQSALTHGRVPPSAHRKELQYAFEMARANEARNPKAYALAVVRKHRDEPRWDETPQDRKARGLTPVIPM
jgi:hypothetical protein